MSDTEKCDVCGVAIIKYEWSVAMKVDFGTVCSAVCEEKPVMVCRACVSKLPLVNRILQQLRAHVIEQLKARKR